MPSPRIFLADTRNPARWTKLDRNRPCEWAGVSIAWDKNPFGLRPVRAFPMVQPGIFRVDGKPAGEPKSFNATLGALVDENPSWSLISGRRLTLWSSGNQTVTAIDLTRLDVIEAWTDHILAHFAWAHGIWHDYFTNLAWLADEQTLPIPPEFWRAWDVGYSAAIQRMKLRRPDWIVLGQVHHVTQLSPYADGQFIEEHPQYFGITLAQHAAFLGAHAHHENWVFEIRNPDALPPAYVRQCVEFIESHGCLLSWRRDADAWRDAP